MFKLYYLFLQLSYLPLLLGVLLLVHSAPFCTILLYQTRGHKPFGVSSSHCQVQVTLYGVSLHVDCILYSIFLQMYTNLSSLSFYDVPVFDNKSIFELSWVSKLTSNGSDNGLSPGRRLAIIWTSAEILLIGALGTNISEMLIKIHTLSFKKIHLKMSSGKWRPICPGPNVLMLHVTTPHKRCWCNYIENIEWDMLCSQDTAYLEYQFSIFQ